MIAIGLTMSIFNVTWKGLDAQFPLAKDTGQVLLIAGMPLTTALPQGVFCAGHRALFLQRRHMQCDQMG